ncbi:MAG: aminoacyl-tRNA hydrolase [Planctomycetota bacterium]
MKVIVGLGNPGKKFERTRHNIGFRVIDKLLMADLYNKSKDVFSLKDKYIALINEGSILDEKVFLVKPQTYMNNVGETIKKMIYNTPEGIGNLLVVSDDFNLTFGTLRFRHQGSSGGHKGLQSIIEQIGNTKFPRLRIGIGLPDRIDPSEFVLRKFSEQEEKEIKHIINRAVEAIIFYLKNGIEMTMNRYN